MCDKDKDLPGSTLYFHKGILLILQVLGLFLPIFLLMELKNMQETQEGIRAGEEKRGRCLDLKDYDDEDERLIFLDPHGWDIASAPF